MVVPEYLAVGIRSITTPEPPAPPFAFQPEPAPFPVFAVPFVPAPPVTIAVPPTPLVTALPVIDEDNPTPPVLDV